MNMKTKQKTTFLVVGAFLLFIALLSGCVDIPSEGPTPPPLKAEYRFIHGATDMGEVGVTVDGKSLGNLAFKGVTPHTFFASGTKSVVLSNGETVLVSMSTDYRGTFVLLPQEGNPPARTFVKLQERRMFDSATIDDTTGAVRPVNCSNDVQNFDIDVTGADGTITWANMPYRSTGTYARVTPGQYTISVKKAGTADVWTSATVDITNIRNTVCLVGNIAAGNLTLVVVQDN